MRSQVTRGLSLTAKLSHYSKLTPSGCILWVGQCGRDGYGRLKLAGADKAAHRLAWLSVNGPIPAGLHVCHRCDVRACINVDHLFLGTHSDNMRDMAVKGRARTAGERASKLTPKQAAEILSDRRTQEQIAADYGIHRASVSRIQTGRRWPQLVRA